MPQTGAEGAYLLVNKNLIELFAVLTVMAFRTGALAGLDRFRARQSGVSVSVLQTAPQ
jgi:thiosulfate dehydrogenase [quinone] large subunit